MLVNQSGILKALLVVSVVVLAGWAVVQRWPGEEETLLSGEAEGVSQEGLIALSEAKLRVADIRTQSVARSTLELTRTLPARFAYDDRFHVAVRAPSDAVIKAVLVKPGDVVKAGQSLAILISPPIGEARSEVLRRETDVQLAQAQDVRQAEIREGVLKLVESIRAGRSGEEIRAEVGETTLGAYRSRLLTAYSRYTLAARLSQSGSVSSGAISGRVLSQRRSDLEQASAELEGAVEQALFDSEQAQIAAASKTRSARRGLQIAKQDLATLLDTAAVGSAKVIVSANESDLARMEVRAPIDGTVERRTFSATERVSAGSELFVVADTSRLWVEADVRAQDWGVMTAQKGDAVVVTTPADPTVRLAGSVHYVGREVDVASGAVPLVVEVENPGGRFRPGLFARVEVPIEQVDDALAVPRSAVIDVEGQPTVFVGSDGRFQAAAVKVGRTTPEALEIVSGIQPGQSIVVNGAFLLKSEWLLEGEE